MGDEKKPWEIGKSFDKSAPLGPLQPASKTGPFTEADLAQGQRSVKQSANLNQMIWTVAEQISKLSQPRVDARRHHLLGNAGKRRARSQGDGMTGHIDKLPDISVKVV
jgi:hypothetical protein